MNMSERLVGLAPCGGEAEGKAAEGGDQELEDGPAADEDQKTRDRHRSPGKAGIKAATGG